MNLTDISRAAFGDGIIAIFDTQVFPFMLSSAFTARTIVQEKDQVAEVQTDIWYAVSISVAFGIFMAILLHDLFVASFGIVFPFILLIIYEVRGELI